MLQALVQTGFSAVDGREFSVLDACPGCGGEVTGYDRKRRKFATVLDEGRKKEIMVHVRRFRCRQCGAISPAKAPFYPDTRIGSPLVDLCIILSRSLSPGMTAAALQAFGILVDRGTVRNLMGKNFGEIPTTEMFGFLLPRSVVSLSLVAFRNP